jgi:hypothetical protein
MDFPLRIGDFQKMVKESSKVLGVLQNISNDAPGVKGPGRSPRKKGRRFYQGKKSG